jgi:PIN domain nuclease of toxin-antitoxin system
MRYYLDTNVLVFILHNDQNNIHSDVKNIIVDYANTLLVSSVVMQELLLLFRIGKFIPKSPYKSEQSVISAIADLGIKTVFFNENHFIEYSKMTILNDHKDMNDHLIISQAISDKIALISSDAKFPHYEKQKLKFIFNKR